MILHHVLHRHGYHRCCRRLCCKCGVIALVSLTAVTGIVDITTESPHQHHYHHHHRQYHHQQHYDQDLRPHLSVIITNMSLATLLTRSPPACAGEATTRVVATL